MLFIVILCLLLLIIDAEKVCLHNETMGKRCTSSLRKENQRVNPPTPSQNQKCDNLCKEMGYIQGGYCSVSKTCFHFCECLK